MEHDDYPHFPGSLPGCRACEEECNCAPELTCLSCSILEFELNDDSL